MELDVLIPENDSVRLISQFVEEMDLTALYDTYERMPSEKYASPEIMLKVMLYAVQIHSAKIDENIEGIVPVLKGSLEAMNAIRENTEPIPQIYELLQTIKRDGLKAI